MLRFSVGFNNSCNAEVINKWCKYYCSFVNLWKNNSLQVLQCMLSRVHRCYFEGVIPLCLKSHIKASVPNFYILCAIFIQLCKIVICKCFNISRFTLIIMTILISYCPLIKITCTRFCEHLMLFHIHSISVRF